MKKCICLLLVWIIIPLVGFSQKQTNNINRMWFGFMNQTRFSKNWGMWADVHLRTDDNFVDQFSSSIFRIGATYYFTDQVKLTAAYAYIHEYPNSSHQNISRPEHRPWQQLQWHSKYGKQKMMQWFRLEERYRRKILNDNKLADGYQFNWRVRYNILYEIPLSKKAAKPGGLSWIISDEILVNMGKEVVNNYFDHNRFFTGLKIQVNKHDNFQIGYLNVFQQLASGNHYNNFHIIRLFYFQNLDFRKK
jgi:Protein of unknown function (DUF2490)